LGKPEIKKIVDLELDKVAERLRGKGIEIKVTEPAKEFLSEIGFDANLGARPLKRVIQKQVLDPLSLKIVSGEVKEGERITIDFFEGKIKFITARDFIKVKSPIEKIKVSV